MAQSLIGIDIGTYSIKAAVFEANFKEFQLTDLYESSPLRIDEMSREDALKARKEGLRNFIEVNGLESKNVIACISGAKVSHRGLTLPFKDRRQIEKILPFELESYLPFELEDLVVDFQVSESSKVESKVIAFALKRQFLIDFLEIFEDLSLSPRIVDIDVLSLVNISHMSNVVSEKPIAIMDFGHSKTSICIVEDGHPVSVRTILKGSRSITEHLRKDLDLTFQQAEEVKHKYGVMNLEKTPLKDPKQIKIAKSVGEVLHSIVIDLQQTIHNYEGSFKEPVSVNEIFVCGGGSLLKNFTEYFAESTGRKVKTIQCEHKGKNLASKIGPKQAGMVQALSLGVRGGLRGVPLSHVSQVNFRKGEFAPIKSYEGLADKIRFAGIWAAVLTVLLIVQFGFNYIRLASDSAKLEEQILKEIATIMPDVPKSRLTSSKQALNIMRGRISEYKERVDVLTSGLRSTTALDVLKEISAKIPATIQVDVREISIDRNKVFLKGDTDSFTSVDKIVASLQKYELFSKVEKGAISDSPDGNKKRFSISMVVGGSDSEEDR